jgi:hypothetical protein
MSFQALSDFNASVKDRAMELVRVGNDVVYGFALKTDKIRVNNVLTVIVPGLVAIIDGERVRSALVSAMKPNGAVTEVNVFLSLNVKAGDRLTVSGVKRNKFKVDDDTYDLITATRE